MSEAPAVPSMSMDQKADHVLRLLTNMTSNYETQANEANEELDERYGDAEATLMVCHAFCDASHAPNLRMCAGSVLKERLAQSDDWESREQQLKMQNALLDACKAMTLEDYEGLQLAVMRNLGLIMGQVLRLTEDKARKWNENVFNYLDELCLAKHKERQLLGATTYHRLVKTSPKIIDNYLQRILDIFMRSADAAERANELTGPVIETLFDAWTMTIPMYRKHEEQQEQLANALPLIMQLTRAYAYEAGPMRSTVGFDVIDKINKLMPDMLWPHLKLVLDDLFAMVNDVSLCNPTRMKAIGTVQGCVRCKRRQIIRFKLMDKVLLTLYELLATKPAQVDEVGEELLFGDSPESYSPAAEAAQTLLFIGAHSDTNRVAERSLRLMGPQLENQSPIMRAAAHHFLSLMAKSFTDLLGEGPLYRFVDIVEGGVHDVDPTVRRAAFSSLSIMAENLQPEITTLAPTVLPLFGKFFDEMTPSQRQCPEESDSHGRMFCTLEIYCESLKPEALQPHLAELMRRLMQMVQPNENSLTLRQLALSAITSLAKMTQKNFSPYFDAVMAVALPLVKHNSDEDQLLLRSSAVQLVTAMNQVNTEKFAAHAPRLFESYLEVMSKMSGAQVFTYELLGVLASYVPERIELHFTSLMKGILATIREGLDEEKESERTDDGDEEESDAEASVCADEDSVGDLTGHGDQTDTENNTRSETSSENLSSPTGHDEAIMCLKAFTVHLPDAMALHMFEAMPLIASCTGTRHESGRRYSYEALTQFTLLNARRGNMDKAKRQCHELIPELVEFVETAKETTNTIGVMGCITDLLQLFKADALAAEGFADLIFNVIRRTLRRKLSCQFNIGHDTEMEALHEWSQALNSEMQVMYAVGDLLPAFGYSMRKRQFGSYFQNVSSRFTKGVRNSQPNGQITPNLFFLYTLVQRCMDPLGIIAEQYYDVLSYSVVDCLMDTKPDVRRFAIEQLHWLLQHVTNKDYAKIIKQTTCATFLKALDSNNDENFAANLQLYDEGGKAQICAIASRMILYDPEAASVEQLLHLLYGNLPLRDKLEAYAQVVNALRQIYLKAPPLLEPHLTQTLQVLMEALEKQQLPDEDTRQAAIDLMALIKLDRQALYDDVCQKSSASASAN